MDVLQGQAEMKQGWCSAQRSLVQGEPGCGDWGFYAAPPPTPRQNITCRTVWAALSRDSNRVRAGVHTVCPLAAHWAICLEEGITSPRPHLPHQYPPPHPTPPCQSPKRKGSAVNWPGPGLSKGHHNAARRCQGSPKENQLLGRGGLSLPESLPIPQRGKVRAGVLVSSASHPFPQQPRLCHDPIQILLSAFPWNPGSPQTYGVQ